MILPICTKVIHFPCLGRGGGGVVLGTKLGYENCIINIKFWLIISIKK